MADTGASANPLQDAVLAALAEAVQKKLNIYSEFLKTLPPSVQNRLKALKHLHDGYAKLENQLKEEIRALEKKYQAQYDVIFAQRSDIVKGTREPTAEELAPEAPATTEENPAKGIPGFWLRVLKNCAPFADTITPADEEALQHLEEVTVRDLEKGEGFIIDFVFSENAFFTNTKLTKTYHLVDDGYDGLTLDRIEGAKIDWKAGKDLTFKLVKKKQSKGKKGQRQTRVVTVKEPAETFFNFFSPPDPENEEIEDEDEEAALESKLEEDFDLGALLKDRVIPHAVLWFTGEEAIDDEDYELGEDEDEDDEGLGGGDDDEDEDEDEEDDAPPARGGRGGRGGPQRGGRGGRGGPGLGAALGGAAGAPPQQDCKQQ